MGSGGEWTSALAVLRTLPGLVTAVLLALDLARVAGDEAGLLEHVSGDRVRDEQRPGDAMSNRRGLRGDAAAADVHRRVVLSAGVRDLERLIHDHARRLAAEVILERARVHRDLAFSGLEAHQRHRALALACRAVDLAP